MNIGPVMKEFHQIAHRYIDSWASVIFLVLDKKGIILEANSFACELAGNDLKGKALKEFLVVFSGELNIEELVKDPDKKYMFNVNTFSPLPQTFYFNFVAQGSEIYAFGNLDAREVEQLRGQLLDANNELNALTRELHKKNAELEKLNQLKNQFLGMASHDLRKPISIVLSYNEFLIDEAGPGLS